MAGRKSPRKKTQRLDVAATATVATAEAWTVPKRWVKFMVGVFLMVPAGVLAQTFFTVFAHTTIHEEFWITEAFWFFALGSVLMAVAFLGMPWLLYVYVFGHELTHAIWVLLLGGRVHDFKVTREGGYILADRTNTWIALAPYFFPIYSVLVLAVYGVTGLFVDVSQYGRILYAALGFTWTFHILFTCRMVPKGQPDLHYGGTLFSLMVIIILNLLVMSVMLILASPHITWRGFGEELFTNAMEFTVWLTLTINRLVR